MLAALDDEVTRDRREREADVPVLATRLPRRVRRLQPVTVEALTAAPGGIGPKPDAAVDFDLVVVDAARQLAFSTVTVPANGRSPLYAADPGATAPG